MSYTTLALLAFAGNSVLCRLALGEKTIDAASFTSIRLLSGILVLAVIVSMTKKRQKQRSKGSWIASCLLFLYAVSFSYAYISLDTGTGALILFAAVQMTMIFANIITGNKLYSIEWLGLVIAFSGFIYFVLPDLTTPSFNGLLLMMLAGIAWGLYTLQGCGTKNPLKETTDNFMRTLPLLVILMAATFRHVTLSQQGILLAVISGAIASGLGYTIWYKALAGLSVTQAAVVQLLVPVIAAIGGVIFANETISLRIVLTAIMILGGILTIVLGRNFIVQLELASRKTEQGK